jgi:adenylate kinase
VSKIKYHIVLIGPEGSGKGTVGEQISEILNVPHISTGDIFRANIKQDTELGREANIYISQSKYCPDDLTNRIVEDRLTWDDCARGYILDGYPRTIGQVEFLDDVSPVNYALFIDVPEDVSINRALHRGRKGDTLEGIQSRLEEFKKDIPKIIDFYNKNNTLYEIKGNQPREWVLEDTLDVLLT